MIELRAGAAKVAIDPASGGRVASLEIDGLELLVARVADPIGWGCYPMAPFAGRIRDGRFDFGGRSWQLERNRPPHAIHGTLLRAAWQRREDERCTGADAATLALEAPLGPGWPFAGRARSRFALTEADLAIDLAVHADDAPFPASIGWHPWFRRRLARGGAARLEITAAEVYRRDAAGIPTGERIAPPPGPWDDCFTGLSAPPRLHWPGALRLTLESSSDHFVVYDEPEDALCVEPQSGPPDAPNLMPRIVEPGHPLAMRVRFAWEIDGLR